MTKLPPISLETIDGLSPAALKETFADLYGTSPPKRASRSFLSVNVAYKLQENDHGGISRKSKTRLNFIARELEKNPDYTHTPERFIKPGTRLIRDWQGDTHEVTVLEDSYEYHGQRYRSLSKIAFVITGTKWSGPAFFGLKDRKRGL